MFNKCKSEAAKGGWTKLRNEKLLPDIIVFNGSSSPLRAQVTYSVRNLSYTVGRTPWTSDQAVARPLPTQRTTDTE
jgi:hypothetical protein